MKLWVLGIQIPHLSSDGMYTSWVLVPVQVECAGSDVDTGTYPSRRIEIRWQDGLWAKSKTGK